MLRRCGLLVLITALAATQAEAAVIFSQDFEGSLGGNESTGGIFVINNTNALNNGTQMMGHRGPYTNDEYSFYQISNLNLTNVVNAFLTFDYRGNFETHFDRFNVLASTSPIAPPAGLLLPTALSNMQYIFDNHAHRAELGNTFYDTSAISGGGSGVARFDLSGFDGQIVNLRFQFGSDGSAIANGFNMDNLQVTGDLVGPAVPEPASLAMMGLGGLGLLAGLRRRRANAA